MIINLILSKPLKISNSHNKLLRIFFLSGYFTSALICEMYRSEYLADEIEEALR